MGNDQQRHQRYMNKDRMCGTYSKCRTCHHSPVCKYYTTNAAKSRRCRNYIDREKVRILPAPFGSTYYIIEEYDFKSDRKCEPYVMQSDDTIQGYVFGPNGEASILTSDGFIEPIGTRTCYLTEKDATVALETGAWKEEDHAKV